MADPVAFKEFVFTPAITGIINGLIAAGYPLNEVDVFTIKSSLTGLTMWDLIDFRVGKKGVQDFMANEKQPVPGVNITTVATVQIRRE